MVPIGYLTKAHGIRGELVFVPTTDSPELADGLVYLRPRHGGRFKELTVIRKRRHHGTLLMTFEGVASRNDAELLRSHTVFIPKDRLPPLEEDEIYLSDLPGLTVMAALDGGTEREIGVIVSADAPAGQMLWSIRTRDGKEILFPAVEEFVLSIDPDKGMARIAPPPGLLDLYLKEDGRDASD